MISSEQLRHDLKILIVRETEKEVDPSSLDDAEILFGPTARLGLDSLDALQISVALQKRYGVRLTDSKETRRVLSSVQNLAEFIAQHQSTK